MTRLPIPDDWDQSTWLCVQVEWPDSPQYIALLAGMLSMLARGRLWDERTGAITDAQIIGRDIWARNWPLTDCEGQQAPSGNGDDKTVRGSGFAAIAGVFDALGEFDDMAGSILDIRCVGNELQVQRFPCCEWETICTVPGGAPSAPEPYPDADPETEFCACGMATAIVEALYDVCDAVWDAQGSLPWQWAGEVQAALPGYSLSTTQIWSAVQQAIDLDNDYSKAEVLTTFRKEQLICLLAGLLNDGQQYINSAQYPQFTSLPSVVFEGEQRQWVQTCIAIMGEDVVRSISALGALDCTSTCDCPVDPLSPPAGTDWLYDFDFTAGQHSFTASEGSYVAGLGFRGTTNYFSTGSRLQFARANFSGRAWTTKYVGVEYDAPAGSGEGEDDYVGLGGARISENDIDLGQGSGLVYQRQSDVSVDPSTDSCNVDFSRQDTSDNPIVVSRLVIAGNGDDPFAP